MIYFVFLVLLVVTLALYFLPTIVATCRKHRQTTPIALINFFLGWTFLGWIGALAWSFSGPTPEAQW